MADTNITDASSSSTAAADAARTVREAREASEAEARRHAERGGHESLMGVRAADIEPYTGLRYLSKLFRLMAILLILLLIAEVVTGFFAQGSMAIPTLLSVASKLIVSAALLWASGDLAILLIDVGHDVRATRILLGRSVAHAIATPPTTAPPKSADAAGEGASEPVMRARAPR